MNKAYVCVYRHFPQKVKDIDATRCTAAADVFIEEFLNSYPNEESYYDWGDDPSFYSAECTLGSVEHAAWGVCRPDVRKALAAGAIVVFFCAKPMLSTSDTIKHHFIGVGTVREVIKDRRLIWSEDQYEAYRRHYNILARYEGAEPEQFETFHPYHANWLHRIDSPYVLFEVSRSCFNLTSPLHVSTSQAGAVDVWRSDECSRVGDIEQILFRDFGIQRRLRTLSKAYAYRHLNLTPCLKEAGKTSAKLYDELMPLVFQKGEDR
jgi:hypothetical protein